MDENGRVGIVIVNYNGAKFQNECITSILQSNYENYSIIIVDNASTDNSIDLLKIFDDERITIIKLEENCGVARGNNMGIQKSMEIGCSHTLLLNNDTIVTKDFLSKLIACNQDIVSSKIYYYDSDIIWYAGGRLQKLKGTAQHLNYKERDNNSIISGYFDYSPTCCLLVKNDVFNKIGLIDENYFLYFDDTDFCYRANQSGYKIWLCNESIIYHKVSLSTGGDSSPTAIYYQNRNRIYYINKFKLGLLTKCFFYLSRWIKIIKSKICHTVDGYYIKLAISDYKKGMMYRRDNLIRDRNKL